MYRNAKPKNNVDLVNLLINFTTDDILHMHVTADKRNGAKKEEIWLSPMTIAPSPTEKKETWQQTNATKNFYYIAIVDRLMTVS